MYLRDVVNPSLRVSYAYYDNPTMYVQPHLDFGLNLLGGDIMAIPGLYQYILVHSLLYLSLFLSLSHGFGINRLF